MTVRVIPRLDIKGPNLVKGIHMEGLRALGRPKSFARHYYEQGADELVYMDTVASLYGRNSLLDLVRETSQEVFIPLTVGGGLRTVDDIRDALRAGADKVALNTAVVQRPKLIEEAAHRFGSSTIVVSIESIRQPDGTYHNFCENGREETGFEVVDWARQVEALGAGEIFLTSVDREGTGKGYDLSLTRMVAQEVSIPVIAHGGAGNASHVTSVVKDGWADAVSLASILHYDALGQGIDTQTAESEGNVEYLQRGRIPARFAPTSLPTIKDDMAQAGIPCRPVKEAKG